MNFQEFPVYAPTMHREFLPEGLPEGIRSVWPGLPDLRTAPRDPSLWLTPPSLPFTPSQAASCMAGLENLDENGIASFSALTPEMQANARRELREREDLARFARSGSLPQQNPSPTAGEKGEELLRWAQHYLLLGWLQEKRVLDMNSLVERYRSGAQRLAAHIGGDSGEESSIHAELLAAMNDLVPETPDAFLPSWRFMLELFSILLPPETVLCTADDRMIRGLASSGQAVARFSGEKELPFRNMEAADCMRGPVWKLLGRKEPDPDRPWLEAERMVIILGRNRIHE